MNTLSSKDQLDGMYPLLQNSCYSDIVEFGIKIRSKLRDKVYSITDESAEIFVNEGQVKDYVLESYERIHLSYLMAVSYLRLGKLESSKVELRHANEEMKAQIYTSGNDEINLLLISALWESLNAPLEAMPNYRKVISMDGASPTAIAFAKERLEFIENRTRKKTPKKLYVFGFGEFPNVIYEGNYEYQTKFPLGYEMKECISTSGFLLNTSSWTQQIFQRGKDDISVYKRAGRMPWTLLYSTLVFATGAYATHLAVTAELGGEAVSLLAVLTYFMTKRTYISGTAPDMRYWGELPSSFILTTHNDLNKEPCAFQYLYEKGATIRRVL